MNWAELAHERPELTMNWAELNELAYFDTPIEYHAKYQQLGELSHVEGIIKWGTDYFLKTFDSSAADTIHDMMSQVTKQRFLRLCMFTCFSLLQVCFPFKQVGSAGTERYCGMRPEGIDYERKVDICISECPNLAKEPEEEYIFSLLIELLYIFSTYLYSSSGSLGILIIARREWESKG